MSLLGIDVGTSAVKIGAYAEDGRRLADARVSVAAAMTANGNVEGDPQKVWEAVMAGLARIATADAVRRDPPRGLAISASGDEVFPVDRNGRPLGPCLMSADPRGAEIEAATAERASVRTWYRRCGHVPERMDPVNRILWWRRHEPATVACAARFLGWHEFLTLKLCGRAVTDPSLASKWLAFDRASGRWSREQLAAFELEQESLPEIAGWGGGIGTLLPALAEELRLPPDLVIGVGAFDSVCTALGLGVSAAGIAGLACGTWEVLAVPLAAGDPDNALIEARLPIVEYPGEVPRVVLWQSPNGSAVANWAARLTGQSPPLARANLKDGPLEAGDLIAIPHIFGSVALWSGARDSRGAILGMTGATTQTDVYRAMLDAVACDLALALQVIGQAGAPVRSLRAGGGGTNSTWWMQRKADLTGKPVEVCAQPEPGTFGAALLAGAAAGVYSSAGVVAGQLARVQRTFEPSTERAAACAERLRRYRRLVPAVGEQPASARPAPRSPAPARLSTPALVVDLEVFEANLAAAREMLGTSGKALRPHFKTHRCPALALRQRGPAVIGFTCATVGEAEALVAAGIEDVLVANEIVDTARISAVAALAERARVTVAVDALEPLLALAAEARWREVVVGVLIDIDVGLDRCGVRSPAAARDLALAAASAEGIRFDGIMGYEGRLRASVADRSERSARAFDALAAAKAEIERAGLRVSVVSAAGTSTLPEALRSPVVTEIQAGTYAVMEPDLEPLGLPFGCAERVVGTVISRRPGQVVLDVGRRAVGCDSGLPPALAPGARTLRVNDEHAVLAWDGEPPALGTLVSLRPTQNRTTFNLHSTLWLCRQGQLVEQVAIAAGR